MDAAGLLKLLQDMTDSNGAELVPGKRFRLHWDTQLTLKITPGCAEVEFSPPADAGQELLNVAVLTKWVKCRKLTLTTGWLVLQLDGWPHQVRIRTEAMP